MKQRRNWWTVLSTKSLSGAEASRRIIQQGFELYLPLYREPPRKRVRRVAPLFPGYLFVRVGRDNWKPLASTRDVRKIFMCGDLPASIADAEIEQLRSLENSHGFIEPDFAQPPGFVAGESVQATSGFFRDKFGKYVGLVDQSGARRVRVMFEMLGSQYVHEISAFDLARVAA